MHPYTPRPIRFLGVQAHADWRLKFYSIVYGSAPFDAGAFGPGLELALATLPSPAVAEGRPGLGFVIFHRGRSADYLVLGWWDNENELPLRVFVCPARGAWRAARGGESVCVWDLQVIGFERDAYVATLLAQAPQEGPSAVYLAQYLDL